MASERTRPTTAGLRERETGCKSKNIAASIEAEDWEATNSPLERSDRNIALLKPSLWSNETLLASELWNSQIRNLHCLSY